MRKPDVYWQIYCQDQIKPQWRGQLLYVLEIPRVSAAPVLRHVFDPSGKDFPCGQEQRRRLLERLPHAIAFCGLNKMAVKEAMRADPRLSAEDQGFLRYNHAVVRNSQALFLRRGNPPPGELVEATARLLGVRAAQQ